LFGKGSNFRALLPSKYGNFRAIPPRPTAERMRGFKFADTLAVFVIQCYAMVDQGELQIDETIAGKVGNESAFCDYMLSEWKKQQEVYQRVLNALRAAANEKTALPSEQKNAWLIFLQWFCPLKLCRTIRKCLGKQAPSK
jgi:hypothetical protein